MDAVAPASGLGSAEEQFQQMAGIPSFAAEGIQTTFAAAEDGSLPQFLQPPGTHHGALFRVGGTEHMEIAAATGMSTGIFRFCPVTAVDVQQFSDACLLSRIPSGGTGIMPDEAAHGRFHIGLFQIFRQHRPNGNELKDPEGQCLPARLW